MNNFHIDNQIKCKEHIFFEDLSTAHIAALNWSKKLHN